MKNVSFFIGENYSSPPRNNYETNKTITKTTDDTWSMDTLDLSYYGTEKKLEIFLCSNW